MGMAHEQDLPLRKEVPQPWTARRLFPLAALSTAFSKSFINVFDVLLGLCVLFIGFAELLGRQLSWLFYVITMLIFFAAFIERRANALKASEPKK